MTRDAASWTAPARIGRYVILERIGKGAMGVVYSARDEVMDRRVAVKVMMTDLEAEPDIRARFYREAQAAGRLLHPNIVTIFDAGEDEGRIYIVMELLKGVTLNEYLRQPGVALEQKIGLMVQMCEGLAAAHSNGIVHRDIKPGNLFVLNDGTLKILDFGVARLANSTMTASGFIIGTPDYMSPEQARGKEIDGRSDLFSVAGVFYYMLTGRKPFGAPDMPSVLRKVQSEMPRPVPESESPAALTRIVMRSLAKDPAERHQSAAELAADVLRFRRHFDSETRQIALAVKASYDAIDELARERAELARRLGVPPYPVPPATAGLRNEYPAFVEPGVDELVLVPFTRASVQDFRAALSAEEESLAVQVKELRAADVAIARSREAIAAGQFDAAEAALNEARGVNAPADAVDPVADVLLRARRDALARAALATTADDAISLARAEFHAGHRAEALAVLRACLASEPSAPGVESELVGLQAEMERLGEIERRAADEEKLVRAEREREAAEAAAEFAPTLIAEGVRPIAERAEDEDTVAIAVQDAGEEVDAPVAGDRDSDSDDTVSQALAVTTDPPGIEAPGVPGAAPSRPAAPETTASTSFLRELAARVRRLFRGRSGASDPKGSKGRA